MSTSTYIPAHIKFKLADAEQFIQTRIECDSSVNGFKPIVKIEAETKSFELLPCLQIAKKVYQSTDAKDHNPTVKAIRAFRLATQARGFDLGLADCKAVVEQFIK